MILILLFIPFALIDMSEATEGETVLTDADFQRGNALPEFPDEHVDEDPMFTEGLIEGDIFPDNYQPDVSDASARKKRNVLRGESTRWPKGRVPYKISTKFNEEERSHIAQAIAIVKKAACITFEEKTPKDVDWVLIRRPVESSCASSTGRKGGKQFINLGVGCFKKGLILHELLHTLGFMHEHNRPDRDSHIEVLMDNVVEGERGEFTKQTTAEVETIGPYDYDSVMHNSDRVFGKRNQAGGVLWGTGYLQTIKPFKAGAKIGQRIGLSAGDIYRLKEIYTCPTDDTTATAAPSTDCADALVDECKDYAPVSCTFFVALGCQKTCGFCGEGSNPVCMAAYVAAGGNPEACNQPEVKKKCADFCASIQNGSVNA